ITVFGAPVELKRMPDCLPGHRDTYERNCVNPEEQHPAPPDGTEEGYVNNIRTVFGFPSENLNECQIYTYYEEMEADGVKFGVWRHEKRFHRPEPRPCYVYIHGGGWIAGTVYAIEQQMRFVTELADAVVFNVDYTLAPAGKYPLQLHQIYALVEKIHAEPEKYGIDPEKIMIGGDSAGGNMSAAISQMDKDLGNHFVKCQYLSYPAVFLGKKRQPDYSWRLDDYEKAEDQQEEILNLLAWLRDDDESQRGSGAEALYVAADRADEAYASPALAGDLTGLPRTIVATAEYDGLRIPGEYYASLLYKNGVDVRTVRYCGCQHAILDRLGYVPQAEYILSDMAKELNRL
ncbi:MAG: alpha/beta hydrolase fold domain-containing protein, partial [Lachnospiraceae bacterium]|nr:alpha/beta hydrolase fold domain-containing protein [Lachnospiraceae bacterium]